jgi:hypothetical protein
MKGYGKAAWDATNRRVFLMERSGPSDVAFKRESRGQLEAMTFAEGANLDWEVLGLSISLPRRFRFFRWDPLSGRIRLVFRSRFSTVVAERWSLADRLLQDGGLAVWARKAFGATPLVEREGSVRLVRGGVFREASLVVHQADRNQILVLRERGMRLGLELDKCVR